MNFKYGACRQQLGYIRRGKVTRGTKMLTGTAEMNPDHWLINCDNQRRGINDIERNHLILTCLPTKYIIDHLIDHRFVVLIY